jgi:hypothetical protein
MATLVATLALVACGSGANPDGGDAGPDCTSSCPQPCTVLSQCDGGLGVAICASGFCQSAGGAPQFALADVGLPASFPGDTAASLVVRVLDTVLPTSGPALDCSSVLDGVDAGTLDVDNLLEVNPLFAAYSVSLQHLSSGQQVVDFEVQSVPSGGMRLLLVEGFLTRDLDAGPDAIGCTSYAAVAGADGGAPSVGLELTSW